MMEWHSGQPIAEGYYLCVIIDEHCGPKELFWDGSSWLYPHHNWEPLENNEVAYYLY